MEGPSTMEEPSDPSSNIDPVPSSEGEWTGMSRGERGVVGEGDPILFCKIRKHGWLFIKCPI